jgi:hypothetical protein
MSNSLEEIIEYFQIACYAELAEYMQQLSSADELDDLLNLLDTHQIRRIVRNSIKNQAKLIGSFHEQVAIEQQSSSSSSIFNTSHISGKKEAEEMLNANFTWLEKRLAGIDTKLTRFRAALRAWIDTSSNEVYESGLLGGIIGGLLLGPVGAFAGAWIGSSTSSGSAGSEFKREFDNLLIDYNHLLNEVKESLDECYEMSGELFSQILAKFALHEASKLSEQKALPSSRKTFMSRLLPWRRDY